MRKKMRRRRRMGRMMRRMRSRMMRRMRSRMRSMRRMRGMRRMRRMESLRRRTRIRRVAKGWERRARRASINQFIIIPSELHSSGGGEREGRGKGNGFRRVGMEAGLGNGRRGHAADSKQLINNPF